MNSVKHVEKLLDEFKKLTTNPHLFLGIQLSHAKKFTDATKQAYDFTKSSEIKTHSDTLPKLITEKFDEEQIWQELELQNNSSIRDLLSDLSKLVTSSDFLNFQIGRQQSEERTAAADDEDLITDELEVDESDSGNSDEELTKIKTRLKSDAAFGDSDSGDDLDFDFDAAVDQLAAYDSDKVESDNSGDEQASGNVDRAGKIGHSSEKGRGISLKFKDSIVDDKFFKLSELEEFLNQEDFKEEKKFKRKTRSKSYEEEDIEEEEAVDLFDDIPSDDEDKSARSLKYKDFFDPPLGGDKKVRFNVETNESDDKDSEEERGEEEESEEDDEVDERESDSESRENKKDSMGRDLLSDSDSDGEDADEILGIKKDAKSNFEKRQEKLKKKIKDMEDASLTQKPWQLLGEVAGSSRPENSLLEEHLEFEHTTRLPPVITEETTKSLEDIIIQRIKDKAWDDVERKIKPKEDPFEYKKRIVLDQEKSKKSLGEIYEEEFLKQQQTEEVEKEDPDHSSIKNMMQSLFIKLDALSNFHYTPKLANTDVKIVSNLPSVNMEEVAPVSFSDAKLLAPEEIQDKNKTNEKGSTEKTDTDRKRERREKKIHKRKKIKEKEKRQKLVEKLNPGLGNKYSKDKAMKKLEKDSKYSKDVTIVKETKKKASMSSAKFFKQLQEEVTTQIKSKKAEKRKTSDKEQASSKKLKL